MPGVEYPVSRMIWATVISEASRSCAMLRRSIE